MLDNVRSPTPPSPQGALGPARRAPSEGRNLPQPAMGSSGSRRPFTVAEASSRSSWPTLALHPRGGHCLLSAAPSRGFSELEKFDKLTGRGILGAVTSIQGLARPPSSIGIDGLPAVSRTIKAYQRGGAIEQDGFRSSRRRIGTAGTDEAPARARVESIQ